MKSNHRGLARVLRPARPDDLASHPAEPDLIDGDVVPDPADDHGLRPLLASAAAIRQDAFGYGTDIDPSAELEQYAEYLACADGGLRTLLMHDVEQFARQRRQWDWGL